MSLYNRGENEFLKGMIHGATGVLVCLIFNHSIQRRLKFNTFFYGTVVIMELFQMCRHIKGESE